MNSMHFRQTDLSALIRNDLCKNFPLKTFGENEIIFLKDDTEDTVYFLASGTAKSIGFDASGKSVFFMDYEAGDIFGYYAAFTKKPRSATLVSQSAAQVYVIDAGTFMEFVTKEPKRAEAMIIYLTLQLRHNTMRITRNSIMSSQERVAAFLIYLAEESGGKNLSIESRENFASQLDLTRETLSRILNKLAKDNIIALSVQQIEIRDSAALYKLISQEST